MPKPYCSQLPVNPTVVQDYGLPILPPSHPERIDHATRWLAHVQAGRIGTVTPPSGEQLVRHIRNARVLAGGVR